MSAALEEIPPIDYDAGIIKRRKDERSVYVIAYVDKPGTYYYDDGRPCNDDAVVRDAGFDIQKDRHNAMKLAALEKARAEIEARFDAVEEEINGMEFADVEVSTNSTPEGDEVSVDVKTFEWIPSDPAERVAERIWVREPGEINRRHEKTGAPRGTSRFSMEHRGRGKWNIVELATGIVRYDSITSEEAEAILEGKPIRLFDE